MFSVFGFHSGALQGVPRPFNFFKSFKFLLHLQRAVHELIVPSHLILVMTFLARFFGTAANESTTLFNLGTPSRAAPYRNQS